MNLSMQTLEFHVGDLNPSAAIADTNCQYSGVNLLAGQSFYAERIYIAKWEDIRQLTELPRAVICIGGGEAALLKLRKDDLNLLIFTGNIEIGKLFERLVSVFELYNNAESKIQSAIINDEPFNELLSIVSRLFSNPVMLTDAALRLIGYSDDCIGTDKLLTETIEQGMSSTRAMRILKRNRSLEMHSTCREAFFVDIPPLAPYINSNIFDNDERIATLTIHMLKTPLDERLLPAVEYITHLVYTAILKSTDSFYLKSSSVQKLILDMLAGMPVEKEIIQRCLETLGWDLGDEYQLICIIMDKQNLIEGTAKYTQEIAKSLYVNSIFVKHSDSFFLVLHQPCQYGGATAIAKTLSAFLEDRGCLAGLSMPFHDFTQLPAHYKLACAACEIGSIQNPGKRPHSYEDNLIPHLIGLCEESIDILSLCHPGTLRLRQYDLGHDSALLHSLYVYLAQERSLAAASRILNIHRNTLVYRLNKAQEIYNMDLDDPAVRFHIIWSYHILNYLSIYRPVIPAT